MTIKPTFQGEVQFRRYSDTSTQGQQIVLSLADREALQAFIGLEGSRFMTVFVRIGDDEQPIPSAPQKDTRGPLCREACELCISEEFWEWLGVRSEPASKNVILNRCGITSRKQLDTDEHAGRAFVDLVRIPFMQWRRNRRQGK